jgi:hypothetical protein
MFFVISAILHYGSGRPTNKGPAGSGFYLDVVAIEKISCQISSKPFNVIKYRY